jgi:hypothetical protein
MRSFSSVLVSGTNLVVTLLVLAQGTACVKGGGSAEADPAAAIEGFDATAEAGSRPRSRLDTALLAAPGASREAALAHLEAKDPDVRIAAVYALSLTVKAEDADALASLLNSRDSAERVLAAAGMLSLGDGRGVPPLIGALGIEDPLPFGDPPLRVWEQARFALLRSTGQDFGLGEAATAEAAVATARDWESWWADAEASFEVVRAPELFRP